MVASDQNRPQVNAFGHLLIRKQELSRFLHNLNNPAINSSASLENAEREFSDLQPRGSIKGDRSWRQGRPKLGQSSTSSSVCERDSGQVLSQDQDSGSCNSPPGRSRISIHKSGNFPLLETIGKLMKAVEKSRPESSSPRDRRHFGKKESLWLRNAPGSFLLVG